jgi:CxxC-x17-CxxC domain-containing protein
MRNFNSNNRFSGNRDFNRKSFGGGRDFDRPMFRATCDRCGKECELPFKPTGSRPVYCNDCFKQSNGTESRGFENRNTERSRFEPRFEPRKEFTPKSNDSFQYKQQFDAINAKLDKLIKLMTPAVTTFTPLTENISTEKSQEEKKATKKAAKKKSKV